MLHLQIVRFHLFNYELSDSILKQLIKHLFHKLLLIFRFKLKYGCSISSKITKIMLYFEYHTVTQRSKDYLKLCISIELPR